MCSLQGMRSSEPALVPRGVVHVGLQDFRERTEL
jgi:hypothetical protein